MAPRTSARARITRRPRRQKVLVPSTGPSGTTMWTRQITLPNEMGDRFRIVITEFERFGPTAADRRLVYADAIEVKKYG